MSERNITVVDLDNLNQIEEEVENMHKFGNAVKNILESVIGQTKNPFSIKGDKSKVDAFVEVIRSEKQFMETYNNFGLEHPEIKEAQKVIEEKVQNFQNIVGVDWPLR